MCKGKKHTQQGKLAHACLCHCDCPELCMCYPPQAVLQAFARTISLFLSWLVSPLLKREGSHASADKDSSNQV